MSANPNVGDVMMVGFNFVPSGWLACDGSLVQIADYDVLYQLLGTTYGGDGQTTFGLPDLRGRVPLHQGSSGSGVHVLGGAAGQETATLTSGQMPSHTHPMAGANAQTSVNPAGLAPAVGGSYGSLSGTQMAPAANNPGGSQPHDNMQPFLAVTFVISPFGVFPTPA